MEDAKNIAKNYNPAEFEDKLYNEWVEKGYFHAEVDKNKKPFTIVIPCLLYTSPSPRDA